MWQIGGQARKRFFAVLREPAQIADPFADANFLGYGCVLLEDCCGATDRGNHEAAIKMVKMQGGVFGAVARSTDLLRVLP